MFTTIVYMYIPAAREKQREEARRHKAAAETKSTGAAPAVGGAATSTANVNGDARKRSTRVD